MVAELTPRQARSLSLTRHALASPGTSILDVGTALVGLHATNPTTPYLTLRPRLAAFERNDLDDVMWQSWRTARVRAMRNTMFVLPLELVEIAWAATAHLSDAFAARWLRDAGLTPATFDRYAELIERELAEGALTVRQIRARLGLDREIDVPGIVGRMCELGILVGGASPRSWRSPVRAYHRWQDVLPDVHLDRYEEEEAITELVRRYIATYGPVTVNDVSWWTGFTMERTRLALAALDSELTTVSVDGWPGPLVLLGDPSDADETDDRISAIPVLDPYVQGYKDRERFLADGRHEYVYDGGGNATATILVDGFIVGVWQAIDQPPTVRYHVFDDQAEAAIHEIEAELADAGALVCEAPVDVNRVATMRPLVGEVNRSADHPLDATPHRARRTGSAKPGG